MRLYSNAFNFSSFLSGGVDVRTGQYGCRIQLATIAPEGPADGSRDIALSFSMMEERNTGYGLGWTLTQSEYDENTRRLRLISGDVYTSDPLPPAGSRLNFRDQKLQNLAARRIDANTLHVIHSDGVVEVLTRRRSGTLFVLTQLIFENGERFNLSYTTDDLLESVTNPARTPAIVTMRYNNQQLQSVAVLQERGRVAHTHLSIFNQQLTSISLPSESASSQNLPGYTFAYQDVNGWLAIRSLQNPLGGSDELVYTANGHQFFSGHIPFVSQLTSRSGAAGTADITHRYSYSPNSNFTGFPFGGSPADPAFDNIYVHTSEYNYSCTDQVIDASGSTLLQTQTTFNRFHLQTLEQTIRGTNIIEVRHLYNETANLAFAQQPPNLQLIKETETTYRRDSDSRKETEYIITDYFGNELSRTPASGVRHVVEYYPIAGTSGRCPAEPHGLFQRFVSREIIHAAAGGGGTKTTDYTYTSIPGLAGGVPYVLLQSSVFAGLTNQSTYQQSATAALHGKLTRSQVTLIGTSATSRIDFTYSLSGDVLTENRTAVGSDNTSLSLSQSTSVVNHLLLSTQKNNVLTIEFAYDINGRITSETVSPGLPNQAVRRYAYFAAGGGNLARTEMTDALGGIYVTRYNGFARPVSVHQRIPPNNEQLLQENTYDRLGQVVTQATVDRIRTNGTVVERRLTTQYAYDGWGYVNREIHPDNSISLSNYDPISQSRTTGVDGNGFIRRFTNRFGKAAAIEQVATNNESTRVASYSYDGFGRCVSQTDVHGSTTSFTYDAFDRILTESFAPTAAGGGGVARTITNSYATHLVELAKTSIKVNGTELAQATYDGLGRHTQTSRGGSSAPTVISYNNNSTLPTNIRSPLNINKSFQYNMQLEATTQINVPGHPPSNFNFHAATGGLASASNTAITRNITEDGYGRIAQDTSRIENSDYRNAFTYSQAGRLTDFTSALGDTEIITYDNVGRVSGASISGANGATQVSLTYDSVGRVQSINTTVGNNSGSMLYTLSYDIFGRESSRRIMQNQSVLMTINLAYHRDNRLATREIINASNATISKETFAYDAYGRLTSFTAAGPQYPIDRHGRSVRAQQFSYDVLDNLTNVATSFVGQANDVSQRSYNGADPTQPTQISHTNPAQTITLSYDASGRLTRAGDYVYEYDGFDKLIKITVNGNELSRYGYDASGRQALQFDAGNNAVSFHYAGERLTGVRQANTNTNARFVRLQDTVLARSISNIGSISTELYASDNAQNVRAAATVPQTALPSHVQYMPYGVSAIDSNNNGSLLERHRPGFNGERLDPLARLYHLGNGRRAYDPDLMTFLTPDPSSPFDAGGINAYSYCGGDPINFNDPSGLARRHDWLSWTLLGLGIVLTAVAFPFSIKGVVGAVGAMKVLRATSMVTILTSLQLKTVSMSIAEVDAARGTDNSRLSDALYTAGFAFGVLSLSSWISTAGMRSAQALRKSQTSMLQGSPIFLRRASSSSDVSLLSSSSQTLSDRVHQAIASPQLRFVTREFKRELFQPVRRENQGERAWRMIVGLTSARFSIAVLGLILGAQHVAETYSGASSEEDSPLFSPVDGMVHGMLESVHAADEEFGEQIMQLRTSAIQDIHGGNAHLA